MMAVFYDFSFLAALISTIVLWLFFCGMQLQTGWHIKSGRRCLFLLLGLTGLLLLFLRPTYQVELDRVDADLITNGATPEKSGDYQFKSVYDLLNSEQASLIDTIHLYGYELGPDEISLLAPYHIQLIDDTCYWGITSFDYDHITANNPWQLKGSFYGSIKAIQLIDHSETLHNAVISDTTFSFTLTGPPAGDYIFKLHSITTFGDTLSELLPVSSEPPPSYRMIALASYPSFELNFLKNYWTSMGHGFAQKLKISKDKYSESFTNLTSKNLSKINKTILSSSDILSVDRSTWIELTPAERSAILTQIETQGLGLMIWPTTTDRPTPDLRIPRLSEGVPLDWQGNKGNADLIQYELQSLPKGWEPVKYGNQIIAWGKNYGIGKIILIAIGDTHQLILADESEEYQNLWSVILSHLYNRIETGVTLIKPEWLWAGEKIKIQLITDYEMSQSPVLDDSIPLPFLANPYIDLSYNLEFWASAGYHDLYLPERDMNLSFYVHHPKTWPPVRQNRLRRLLRSISYMEGPKSTLSSVRKEEISIYYWFMLTLFGFGCLWFDEKWFR